MLVTADHIATWATDKRAEGELPLLVRRLIARVGSLTALTMPGGNAVSRPGLDGFVITETGNAWVPTGRSAWEVGKNAVATDKAKNEFKKRTKQTPEDVRSETTFVFVTPRKWQTKEKWRKALDTGEWKAVVVHDACDLEHWLEENAPTALWFADLIGIAGPGVEAVDVAWRRWAAQTTPPIGAEAFRRGREQRAAAYAEGLRKEGDPLVVVGDSREEAVAFLASVAMEDEDLRGRTVVVTDPAGWRFVDANPSVEVVIAANEEVARATRPTKGRRLVVAKAAGGFLNAPEAKQPDRLPRPDRRAFEEALVSIGLDAADAARAVRHCGRSWSVWRRRNVTNPALRHPAWLDRPEARALTTMVLVGAWDDTNATDRAIVAEIAGCEHESLIRDLNTLAQTDDTPVLRIDRVWRAKAPLELFDLVGPRLTDADLDRFFACLRRLLEEPDPSLDLEEDQRWAAAIYGKARRESGGLMNALLDSLVKLAVVGPESEALKPLALDARAAALVTAVLGNADRTRWLSVSAFLSELAEAAPDAYLRALDQGLRRPDDPVRGIVRETGTETTIFGRCWHADLLWSLERLAWAPQRLARVSDILACLATVPKPGNWGNTPQETLRKLFLSWHPQTNAPIERRLTVLDAVLQRHPDIGWEVLVGLGLQDMDSMCPNATPAWRDDDTGRPVVTHDEHCRALRHVHDLLIRSAAGDAERLAVIIEHGALLHPDDRARVWALAAVFESPERTDQDRETLCVAIRGLLHWHTNYDERSAEILDEFLAPVRDLYSRLQPRDPVHCWRWLLGSTWVKLPERRDVTNEDERRDELQRTALREVLASAGWEGLERLIDSAVEPYLVGHVLAGMEAGEDGVLSWIRSRLPHSEVSRSTRLLVAGFLHGLAEPRRGSVADELLEAIGACSGSDGERLAVLLGLPFERATWDRAERLGDGVAERYWATTPGGWCREDEDAVIACEKLLAHGRPCAAFEVLRWLRKRIPLPLALRVLEAVQRTTEPEEVVRSLNAYSISEVLHAAASDPMVSDEQIIPLEVFYFNSLPNRTKRELRTHRKLAASPEFFCHVVTVAHPSEDCRNNAEPSHPSRKIAGRILGTWKLCPGHNAAGVDGHAFSRWVDVSLRLCREAGRGRAARRVIGEMLAHAPAEPDGTWPCVGVRDVLDAPEHEDMRRGIGTGLLNKRGVTSRALDEGGAQERALAEQYRGWAYALSATHWRLSATLSSLADAYRQDGDRNDGEAAWRVE